jgi:hypothetical protein
MYVFAKKCYIRIFIRYLKSMTQTILLEDLPIIATLGMRIGDPARYRSVIFSYACFGRVSTSLQRLIRARSRQSSL